MNAAPVAFPPLSARDHPERQIEVIEASDFVIATDPTDDSDWIDLIDFTPALVNRIRKLNIRTLGQLRGMSPAQLIKAFGRIKAIEVYRLLSMAGFRLTCNPGDEELWQFGFVDASELSRPTDPCTPLAALRPWLGAVTDAVASNGTKTLGELRKAADEGTLFLFSGLTQPAIDRVLAFLTR